MKDAAPVEVRRLPEAGKLRITWDDGHQGEYDYDLLRGYCPCAQCQGHGVHTVAFHPPSQRVTPENIEAVGNYALSFLWSDGHGTGIYRFDFLRQICPCRECVRDKGNEGS